MLDSSQELGGSINWKEKRGLLDLQVSKWVLVDKVEQETR